MNIHEVFVNYFGGDNKMKKMLKCIMCVTLSGMLLMGCGVEDSNSSSASLNNTSGENATDNNTEMINNDKEETSSAVEAESEEIKIETAYGTLYYPKQWEDFVSIEQNEEDDKIVVSFAATISDTSYPLFEVTIGGNEGTSVGEITDSEGTKRTVYMQAGELEEDPNLTETEQKRLYAMQEDLNYVIDHLE